MTECKIMRERAKSELRKDFEDPNFSIQIDTQSPDPDDQLDIELVRELEKEGVCTSHMNGETLCAHKAPARMTPFAILHAYARGLGLALVMVVAGVFWAGVLVMMMWNWFVAPHMAPKISAGQGIGLVILVRVIQRPELQPSIVPWRVFLGQVFVQSGFALGLAYLAHLAMGSP